MNGYDITSTMTTFDGEKVHIEFANTEPHEIGTKRTSFVISGTPEVMVKLAEDILAVMAETDE